MYQDDIKKRVHRVASECAVSEVLKNFNLNFIHCKHRNYTYIDKDIDTVNKKWIRYSTTLFQLGRDVGLERASTTHGAFI